MPEHVAERLSKAADAIISLDHEMSSVRSEIMDAQLSSQMQSNLVKDILNNIENMYKVSNKREVMKIQDEFLRVYRIRTSGSCSVFTGSWISLQRATARRQFIIMYREVCMLKDKKAVLFDLDGTLVDSMGYDSRST